jgi:dephospho-CoA kinase
VPVLGITGGIATGKTLFTECLRSLVPSLQVFDSDRCARHLTTFNPDILSAIRDHFGSGVFDANGVLQRPALRAIVFADPMKRKALEAILHPAIRRTWLELARTIRGQPGNPWLAVDIPLLFETSAQSHFDRIIVVACSALTQRRRLMEIRHLTPGLAESMIASQLPVAEKIERADFAISNDGLPEALEVQARLLSVHLFS